MILVALKDLAVRFAVFRVLKDQGDGVLHCGTADAAMRLCREHRGNIDLLVTDWDLPGAGDLGLFRQLLERHSKVLIVSSRQSARLAARAKGLAFLPVPFADWMLTSTVETIAQMAGSVSRRRSEPL